MQGYNAADVARMLDLSVGQVRSYARAGLLSPDRGPRGEYRFSFQDLVLLRAAKGLIAADIPSHKVRRALAKLRRQVPTNLPLSALHIEADGVSIRLWADANKPVYHVQINSPRTISVTARPDPWKRIDSAKHNVSRVPVTPATQDVVLERSGRILSYFAVGDRSVTVDGTRNMLAAAERAGIERFVHISTTDVYGNVAHDVLV